MYKPYTMSYAFWSQTMYNYMNGIYPTPDIGYKKRSHLRISMQQVRYVILPYIFLKLKNMHIMNTGNEQLNFFPYCQASLSSVVY